jgi:hypothetical protein
MIHCFFLSCYGLYYKKRNAEKKIFHAVFIIDLLSHSICHSASEKLSFKDNIHQAYIPDKMYYSTVSLLYYMRYILVAATSFFSYFTSKII